MKDVEVKVTDLNGLLEQEKEAYKALILPEAHLYFDFPFPTEGFTFVVEARIDQKLVGVALAKTYLESCHADFLSIVVEESYRRQGIAKALFGLLEKHLAEEEDNFDFIRFTFNMATPSGEALRKIIDSYGWSPPSLHLIRLYFDALEFDADWIHDLDPLPPELHIFPWKKRSVRDIYTLDYLATQGRFLPSLSPHNNSGIIDYPTSVGMRFNEDLIGWSITHRIDPDTIRYTSLFIDHFFKNTGYGIRLLIESIRRHKELSVPRALFEINLTNIDHTWGYFVKKRLLPLANKVEKIHLAIHALKRK